LGPSAGRCPDGSRQELARLEIEVNEEKTTSALLGKGESFGFRRRGARSSA
jgi:hypothetical protein